MHLKLAFTEPAAYRNAKQNKYSYVNPNEALTLKIVLRGVLDLSYSFACLASRCVYLMLKQCCGAMPVDVCAVQ